MNWNIIDRDRYILLKNITEKISIPEFYMIGGTALSIQLGLRESYDFDFCVPNNFNNEILLQSSRELFCNHNKLWIRNYTWWLRWNLKGAFRGIASRVKSRTNNWIGRSKEVIGNVI